MSGRPAWHQPPRGDAESAWIEWMQRLPYFEAFGIRCESIEDDRARFRVQEAPMAPNPNGSVNGGIIAAVIDQVMGGVAMRHTGPDSVVNTASLDVRYQRPASAPFTLDAQVTKAGARLVFVDVVVRNGAGQVTNTGSGTMVVVGVPPAAPAATAGG